MQEKQRGMIPFFHLLNYFFCSLKYLLCEKLYIYYTVIMHWPLQRVSALQVVRTSLLSPRPCLFNPPPPPPPGPILLEKGCGQQEGINSIGKQSLLWTSWMLTIGDAEALQSSSWWSSQPKPSKLSNNVIWVVFEGRFLERRIQLQWNRNTSASKGIFREWWFRAERMMNDSRMRVD